VVEPTNGRLASENVRLGGNRQEPAGVRVVITVVTVVAAGAAIGIGAVAAHPRSHPAAAAPRPGAANDGAVKPQLVTRPSKHGDQPVLRPANRPVTLRLRANGRYVTAAVNGSLTADHTTAGPSQTFDLYQGDGYLALRSHAGKRRFVTAARTSLTTTGVSVGGAQVFRVVRNADGTISLLAQATDAYVTAVHGGHVPLRANSRTPGKWGEFTLKAT
jgi:hypothetical protein